MIFEIHVSTLVRGRALTVMYVCKSWKVRPVASWTRRTADDAEPRAQEDVEPIVNRELFFVSSSEVSRAAIIISQRAAAGRNPCLCTRALSFDFTDEDILLEDCSQGVISIISHSPNLHRLEDVGHHVTSGSLAMARVVAGSSLTTLNIYIADNEIVGIAHIGQLKALRNLFVHFVSGNSEESEIDWTGLPGWQFAFLHTLLYSCSAFAPEQQVSFLARCRFPALQTIELSYLPNSQASADVIADFFSRYPLIRDVEFYGLPYLLHNCILPSVQASRLILIGIDSWAGEKRIAQFLSSGVRGLILGCDYANSERNRVWEQVDALETLSTPPSLHWLSLWFPYKGFSRADLSDQGKIPHDERVSAAILHRAKLLAKKGIVLVDQDGLPLHPASSNTVYANVNPLGLEDRAQLIGFC
jgi:hypothetical protein